MEKMRLIAGRGSIKRIWERTTEKRLSRPLRNRIMKSCWWQVLARHKQEERVCSYQVLPRGSSMQCRTQRHDEFLEKVHIFLPGALRL